MKYPKLFLAGKVFETKNKSDQDLTIEVQKAFDDLFNGISKVKVDVKANQMGFEITVHRTYSPEAKYKPSINNEKSIYEGDANLLAGNINKEEISFGYMPWANLYAYYLAPEDFLMFWNRNARAKGFTKVKEIEFISSFDFVKATMHY